MSNDIDIDMDKLLDNPLRIIKNDSNITIQQILNNLLNSDKNLALKTEIYNPKKLALLLTHANYLEYLGLINSAKIIKDFIKAYLTYMVSNKRKSRTEVIKALTGVERKTDSVSSLIRELD